MTCDLVIIASRRAARVGMINIGCFVPESESRFEDRIGNFAKTSTRRLESVLRLNSDQVEMERAPSTLIEKLRDGVSSLNPLRMRSLEKTFGSTTLVVLMPLATSSSTSDSSRWIRAF